MNTQKPALTLIPRQLSFAELRQVYDNPISLTPDESAYQAIDKSHQAVQAIIAKDKAAYGINTGFGLLAKTRIADDELELLQRNLILSHSVGTGDLLPDNVVRLIIVMKLSSLAQGVSWRATSSGGQSYQSYQSRHHAVHSCQRFGGSKR